MRSLLGSQSTAISPPSSSTSKARDRPVAQSMYVTARPSLSPATIARPSGDHANVSTVLSTGSDGTSSSSIVITYRSPLMIAPRRPSSAHRAASTTASPSACFPKPISFRRLKRDLPLGFSRCAIIGRKIIQDLDRWWPKVFEHASDEVLTSWPKTDEPPKAILEHLEVVPRLTLLNQFPQACPGQSTTRRLSAYVPILTFLGIEPKDSKLVATPRGSWTRRRSLALGTTSHSRVRL